jgi:AcrR family transcriptional regulator
MVTERRRPGRRPGSADTRGEILLAARKTFAEKGFDKATIRGIAREAGVDPALVHHYFATKEGVFVAAMHLPLDPSVVVPQIIAGPREQVGERLVRFILTMTEDSRSREPMVGMIRAAMTNEQAVVMIREFVSHAILGRVVEALGVSPLRMQAAFAQMSGLILGRHILRLEPLASAEIDELVELIGPTIQRYLLG